MTATNRDNLVRMLASLDTNVRVAVAAFPEEMQVRDALAGSIDVLFNEADEDNLKWLRQQLAEMFQRHGIPDFKLAR